MFTKKLATVKPSISIEEHFTDILLTYSYRQSIKEFNSMLVKTSCILIAGSLATPSPTSYLANAEEVGRKLRSRAKKSLNVLSRRYFCV